ncbi:hypothetical protein AX774_g4571 [Zancudomyces culisetae]|uniref:Uncharacterized protein n=1 Tax=Zancudomyces culisetae TaxID=1213189 RepID=A0A1R1PLX6_ZANCU|nr:hypothetical protein AX774_g4571 [Zancudomyces culisetae]|eukprot:OMH81965.1 hypothetical protein AX774_g4571 [Zancudomyces culisetae]
MKFLPVLATLLFGTALGFNGQCLSDNDGKNARIKLTQKVVDKSGKDVADKTAYDYTLKCKEGEMCVVIGNFYACTKDEKNAKNKRGSSVTVSEYSFRIHPAPTSNTK